MVIYLGGRPSAEALGLPSTSPLWPQLDHWSLPVAFTLSSLLAQIVAPTCGLRARSSRSRSYATFRNLEALWRPMGGTSGVRSEHSYDECDSHDENEHDNEADDGTP